MSDSNDRTITYPIPVALADGEEYWAHLELESDDFSPPDDFDEPVAADHRRPSPAGDDLGSNQRPSSSPRVSICRSSVNGGSPDSYEWEIRAPGVAPGDGDPYFGPQVNSLHPRCLRELGFSTLPPITNTMIRMVRVPIRRRTSYDLTVSSVAADFFWTPSSPLHTQEITLNGSTSKPSSGLTYEWQVVEQGGPGGYSGCPAAVQCVIPPDTLDPDTAYDVTLTATNGGDNSVKTRSMTVGDGNVAPVIAWSPTNPEIGEAVGFTIQGVPARH